MGLTASDILKIQNGTAGGPEKVESSREEDRLYTKNRINKLTKDELLQIVRDAEIGHDLESTKKELVDLVFSKQDDLSLEKYFD